MAENQGTPSIFRRIYDSFNESRYTQQNSPLSYMGPSSLLSNTLAGINSGAESLQLTAVYACVSRIADTIAMMEASVIRVGRDGSRRKMKNNQINNLISREPNEYIGAYEFFQRIVSDALLYGTGHAFIDRSNAKVQMYHIPASRITVINNPLTGEKFYSYDGAPTKIPQRDILEIQAFRGLNPTHTQLQNLGTAKAVQDFGSTFFKNGGMLGGILSTKEHMSAEQMKQAQRTWESEYSGSHNAHKVAILGGGFQYQPLSVPLEQLQFLEMKKYSTEEIARMYQVPPAMIGMESNTAYSNYEQQVLQFHQGCILPWVRRIELEIERKLLRGDKNLQCVFDVDVLLRADSENRAKFYHSLLQDGVMSINEVRGREGLGPVDGGDEHHILMNSIPLSRMSDYADSVTNTTSEE